MASAGITRVLSAISNELTVAGIARRPGDDTDLSLIPLHIEPDDGPPSLGDRAGDPKAERETAGDVVATIKRSSTAPTLPGEGNLRRFIVDIVYRSRTTRGLIAARALDDAIHERLVETATYGDGILLDEGGDFQTFCLSINSYSGMSDLGLDDDIRVEISKLLVEVYND